MKCRRKSTAFEEKKRSEAESMFELQLSTIQELVVVNSVGEFG